VYYINSDIISLSYIYIVIIIDI